MHPNKCIINPPYEKDLPIRFTLKALELLEKDGRLIIIMPNVTLKKHLNGLTFDILGMARLDFVIHMPMAIFKEQGRTVYTSIFGFTKSPHKESDKVLFYDLESDGLTSIQHKGRVDVSGGWPKLERFIYDTVTNKDETEFSKKRYIKQSAEIEPYGIIETEEEVNDVMIDDLFTISDGALQSSKCNENGGYNFITASEVWKKHDSYTYDTEAIVYAIGAEGSLGRAHHVNGKFIASDLCIVLESRNSELYPIDMEYYSYHLMSIRKAIVSDLKDGTSKLTIDVDRFKRYRIEYIPLDEQIRRKRILKRRKNAILRVRARLDKLSATLYSEI